MQTLLPKRYQHHHQARQQTLHNPALPVARRQPLHSAPPGAAAATASMQANEPAAAAVAGQTTSWSPHAAVSRYLAAGRNWRAVEQFYIELVAGSASLADICLAPAGAAPTATLDNTTSRQLEQQQQQQQQGLQASLAAQPADGPPAAGDAQPQQLQRRTFKVHVSYLGSSFAGWMRQPGKQTVDGTLAAAIAAAGLADTPPGFRDSSSRAKRKAAKAERRANKRASNTAAAGAVVGDCTVTTCSAEQGLQEQQQLVSAGSAAAGCHGGAPLGQVAAYNVAAAAAAVGVQQLPSLNCGGRTDAGVTAVGQVISFYTWQQHLGPAELQSAINQQLQAAIPTKQPLHSSSSSSRCSSSEALPASSQARVWDVAAVDRDFHATFSACWRRYVYLLPLRQQQQQQQQQYDLDALLPRFTDELAAALQHPAQHAAANTQPQQQDAQQQQQLLLSALQEGDVDPAVVNALLQQLQGRRLNYYAYARDTPGGKDCECTLHVARASLVHLPVSAAGQGQERSDQQADEAAASDAAAQGQQQQQQGEACLCIELAGDRFLRRMVRVLVATAVREALLLQQGRAASKCSTDEARMADIDGSALPGAAAAAGGGGGDKEGSPAGLQALEALAASMDRQATAPPAPALGLCFAAVGY